MEQSTANAQYALDLISKKRESGGLRTIPDRSRALELIRKKKGEFNIGKLKDAAIAGTLNTIADTEQGIAIGMDRLGFQRLPGGGAMADKPERGDRLRFSEMVRLDENGMPDPTEEQLERARTERVKRLAGRVPQESTLIERSREDTNVLRQAAAEVAPEPSDGFLANLAENVAGSAPHFAGGIAAAVAGGPVAGAGYFAATEGGAHTTRVYEDLISRGVDPDRALETATNSGVVYAAVSGVLERVGLSKIVPTKGLGKAISGVANSPGWRGAISRIGAASLTEGGTEVLQGMAADALAGYAANDWGDFKDRFTRSDVSLQEFMVGGVMGGGVRGSFEIIDPTNYRTFDGWKADQQAEIDKVETEESVAEGQESPPEPRTAPATDRAEIEPGAQNQPPADQGDGVETLLRANGVEGKEVDPPSERHVELKNRFAELGINVRYVDGGQPLEKAGVSTRAGEIAIDANATEDRQLEALAWHEAVHDVERRDSGAWQRLRDDLRALVPEMYARAEARYALEWKMVTGKDASAERVASEGPSVLAELTIDTIQEISKNPEVFGEIMRKNPSLVDRIIGTLQSMMRRMSMYQGMTRLERARDEIKNTQNHAQAAVLIRDAVNGLRFAPVPERSAPIPPSAPVEQVAQPDSSVDSDGAPQQTQPVAEVEADTQDEAQAEPDPAPRVVLPRNKKSGEFSSRSFRKRRAEIAANNGFDPVGQIELTEDEASLIGSDVVGTNFRGPIPQELKEALEGKPANVRMMFRGNVEGASGAEDAMSVLGADEYVRRVTEFANRGETGVRDFLSEIPEYMEPELAVMDLIDDLRTMGRASWTVYRPDGTMHKTVYNGEKGAKKVLDSEVTKRFGEGGRIEHDPGVSGRPSEALDNPEDLPDGAVFKIEGTEFVAYTDSDGSKRMSSEDGHDVVLTGVPAIPIEKGSLNKNADREAFQDDADPLDAIPFAVAPAVNSRKFRKWFGDSKIVDADGNPLVMYHGTMADFTKFDDFPSFADRDEKFRPTEGGLGFYFTEYASHARNFTGFRRREASGQRTMSVYLSIQNPLNAFSEEYREISQKFGTGGNPRGRIADEVKRRGYDGIVWDRGGKRGGVGFTQVIAFKPEQIKSATGNSGDFDSSNPDIRFAITPADRVKRYRELQSDRSRESNDERLRLADEIGKDAINLARRIAPKLAAELENANLPGLSAVMASVPEHVGAERESKYSRASDSWMQGIREDLAKAAHDEIEMIFSGNLPLTVRVPGWLNVARAGVREDAESEADTPIGRIKVFKNNAGKHWPILYPGRRMSYVLPDGLANELLKDGGDPKPVNDDQGVFGQRMYRANTGRQGGLFQSQEQSETQLDKEIREKADADEKRIGTDPDQGTLFAVNSRKFRRWFGDSKVVDEQGKPKVVYHGTARPDRVGTRFRKDRATSGPMSFFTDDPEIASGYATGKNDTSVDGHGSYSEWFKITDKNGRVQTLDRIWAYLPRDVRASVRDKYRRVTVKDSEDGGTIPAMTLPDGDSAVAGNQHWDYTMEREARGNPIKAMQSVWLDSGNLFGEERLFKDLLVEAGVPRESIKFDDPNATSPGVIPVYLSIQNPLDTSNVPDEVKRAIADASESVDTPRQEYGADMWDKNLRDPDLWVDELMNDSVHVWTSIPDWVSDTLRGMGYDGISDLGGKNNDGSEHRVWIPFEENQVKSAVGNSGEFDPENPDIRFATAWHGTPHNVDRFMTDKIGTGEGAQAYGWGLYFASKRKVAEHYRRTLSRFQHDLDSVAQSMGLDLSRDAVREVGFQSPDNDGRSPSEQEYLDAARRATYASIELRSIGVDAIANLMRAHQEAARGSLLKVDLAPKEDEYLLWDERTESMSEAIRTGLAEAERKSFYRNVGLFTHDGVSFGDWAGQYGYRDLTDGQRDAISRAIKSASHWTKDISIERLWDELHTRWEDVFDKDSRDAAEWIDSEMLSSGINRTFVARSTLDTQTPFGISATGAEAYRQMANQFGPREASLRLLAEGIRGIKYLDGSSRTVPFRDIKREFQNNLPDDATDADVDDAIESGVFNDIQTAFLKALKSDGYLGFDYPSQAITAALTDDLSQYDASSALVESVRDLRSGGTYNYVIFDENDVSITDRFAVNPQRDPKNPPADLPRKAKKLVRRNSTEGMFSGIDPTPQAGLEMTVFRLRRKFQDKFLIFKRLQDQIEKRGGKIDDASNVYRAETLYYGRAAEQARKLQKWIVDPLIDKMNQNDVSVEEVDRYLYAKHAPERNRVIREINPDFDGDGSGMSDYKARRIISEVETSDKAEIMKELADDAAKLREWTLNFMVENDLLSPQQAAKWRETYPNYVPLRTADPGTQPIFGSKGFEVRGPESKKAKGRHSEADSPLVFLIHQAEQSIVRAERNKVGLSLLDLIEKNPDPMMWRVVKPSVKSKSIPNMWGDSVEIIEDNPQAVEARKDENTVVVKQGGEERYLVLGNADLARGFKNLGTQHLGSGVRLLSKLMRFRSALVTSYSPEFIVTNFIRDIQTASFNIGAEMDAGTARRVVKNVRKAVVGALSSERNARGDSVAEPSKWAKLFREYVEDGGKTGWAAAYSFEDRAREIQKLTKLASGKGRSIVGMLRGAAHLIEDLNTAVENGVRVAFYAELKRQGMSGAAAAEAAKNLTVNFNRRGEAGTLMNSLYLFFNAGVQGSTRMVQAASSRRGQKMVLGIVALAAMLGQINAMLSDEDEDGELFYDKISPWQKSHNLILMLPNTGGKYLKIPLPYGYNFFHSIGTNASSTIRGKQSPGESVGHIGSSFLNSFNPLGGGFSVADLSPEILKPAVEVAVNENFAGNRIMPTRFPGDSRPNSQLYYDASPASRWAAEVVNKITGGDSVQPGLVDLSPEVIDHYGEFLTGSAGRFVKETTIDMPSRFIAGEDFTLQSTPFARRLMGSPRSYRHEQKFREGLGEVNTIRSYERRYVENKDAAGLRRFQERYAGVLDASINFKLYRSVIDDLEAKKAAGDEGITDGVINSYRVEANRMLDAAREGKVFETPLLDATPRIGRRRRDARNRREDMLKEIGG